MTHRIKSATISGKVKYWIEQKRHNRWQPVRSYGEVKSFDHINHAENYLNKLKPYGVQATVTKK